MGVTSTDKTTSKDEKIVRVAGADDLLQDVNTYGGINKAEVNATVSVEEIFGQDNYAGGWYRIEHAGANTDTHTITIAATTNDPSSPDRDRPEYSKVITTTASEAGDEIALRDLVINTLNSDSSFTDYFKALKVKDNAIVYIASKFQGEFWEALGADDFNVTTTGGVDVTRGYNDFARRGKATSLSKDPDDPRVGVLGFSGQVTVVPGAISNRVYEYLEDSGSSADMTVDGSGTPVEFSIGCEAGYDKFITGFRIFGNDNGIKFGQFLAINSELTNGVELEIKSDDETITLPVFKSTDDLKHLISTRWQLEVQAGRDDFLAETEFKLAFPLRACGSYPTDDYIKITIQDDLTPVIKLEAIVTGFKKEV